MADYRLLTIWHIEAPLAAVYAAIENSLDWPQWWPGAQRVATLAVGDACGGKAIRRYTWRGNLPYRLVLDISPTRVEPGRLIEGRAVGDLQGVGRWRFAGQGTTSIVRFEWEVSATRRWMRWLAPLAGRLFIRNHALVMARGGAGLAKWLGAPAARQQTFDLLAADAAAEVAVPGRMAWPKIVLTGIAAGGLATVGQLLAWWWSQQPVVATLFRDARLTAALLMGPRVLPPPATAQWDILLVATLIHFALSIVYAWLPGSLFAGRRGWSLAFAGAGYGLAIYAVNLYGLVLLFPWFSVSRGGATVIAHLFFGLVVAGGYRLFSDKP